MAELAPPPLVFDGGCPDPGARRVELPRPLPDIGDDFDWRLGDFDSYRDAILGELARRYPERRAWAAADLEVVLVEALAAVLDQLSDTADRVAAESYLETARRPETLLRMLKFIGLEVDELLAQATPGEEVPPNETEEQRTVRLLELWRRNPPMMDAARRAGPATIRRQRRMASLRDYAVRLEEHPLVLRAQADWRWGGSWAEVAVTVSLWNDLALDDSVTVEKDGRPLISSVARRDIDRFHTERGLAKPAWEADVALEDLLTEYVRNYRSVGQEVFLFDVSPLGVDLAFCLSLQGNYFQSEVEREAHRVLGRGPGGFFEPGRLRFGEDLHISDFYQRLMSLDGVRTVDVEKFKRVGNGFDQVAPRGRIALAPHEVAVCDNDYFARDRGTLSFRIRGGRRG